MNNTCSVNANHCHHCDSSSSYSFPKLSWEEATWSSGTNIGLGVSMNLCLNPGPSTSYCVTISLRFNLSKTQFPHV